MHNEPYSRNSANEQRLNGLPKGKARTPFNASEQEVFQVLKFVK
jgi:hypothetical protein